MKNNNIIKIVRPQNKCRSQQFDQLLYATPAMPLMTLSTL